MQPTAPNLFYFSRKSSKYQPTSNTKTNTTEHEIADFIRDKLSKAV
jgi:hypothetical protein